MTRRLTAILIVALVAGVVALDIGQSAALDPYDAPPLIALGSGQAASGALCSALPGR